MRTEADSQTGKFFYEEKSRIKSRSGAVAGELNRFNASTSHLQHVAKETLCYSPPNFFMVISFHEPPARKNNQKGKMTCCLEGSIQPDPFATKKAMLDFIAKASDGITAVTEEGIKIHIKI